MEVLLWSTAPAGNKYEKTVRVSWRQTLYDIQELPGGLIFVTVVLDAAPCALIPKFSVCQRVRNEN
jgi:hypothetical protein